MTKSKKSKKEITKSAEARKDSERWPFGALLHSDVDRFFDEVAGRDWLRPWSRNWSDLETQMPRVDVIDRDEEIVVKAELPGIDKDDVEVSVTGSTLTIKGSTRKEEVTEDGDYHRREIASRYLSRSVQLPAEVEGEEASASLKDGVLEVCLRKVQPSKQQRIEIGT